MKLRVVALALSIIMIISLSLPVSATMVKSADEILSDFHSESLEVVQKQRNTRAISNDLGILRHETVQELQKCGYDAYEVTGSNYDDIQATLNTDLSGLGLNKDCSYIIVVGDNTTETSGARSTIGSTYNYTYNGTTYTMRTIKITSVDDSNYMQATQKDLLTSHGDAVVQALLDTTISAYMTFLGVPTVFGTIASLAGLTKVNLTAAKATATFHAGTTWTRTFTQVWDDNFDAWTYGSSVEYSKQVCYVNGLKYNASLDSYEAYTTGNKQKTTYSQYYNSSTWKNEQAIIGLLNAWPVFYDKTGDACYEHNSTVVVKHREGF